MDSHGQPAGRTMAASGRRFRDAEQRLWSSVGLSPSERRIFLSEHGIEARVQEVGSGPPVLFVHGAWNSGASWAPLVCGLDGFRCIALDRPGCGLSDPLPVDPTGIDDLDAYADRVLVSVLDGLDLERASVVATSYGGYLALRGAAANPSRIDRMVLLGWSLGAPMPRVPLAMRISGVGLLGRLMTGLPVTRSGARALLRQVGLGAALDSGRFTVEALDCWVALLRHTETRRNELRSIPGVIHPLRGLNERVLLRAEVLSRIEAHTHFLWGEDDPNGGAAVARSFTGLMRNAELELRPGVGHAPWIDEPEHTTDVVRRFLTR